MSGKGREGVLVHCLKKGDVQGGQAGNWVCPAHNRAYYICYLIMTKQVMT